MPSPSRSLIWPEKMTTAMPLVKPAVTGYGMNLTAPPSRVRPMTMSMTPAMTVASTRPS